MIVSGSIDRIDRLPSGGIEVIDYKTGRVSSQKGVDESLQLSIYALACRDALGLGTPGAGDALLHGVGDAAEHDPHGRAAGRGPGRHPGADGADPVGRLRGDAVAETRAGGATSRRCARAERGDDEFIADELAGLEQ